MFEERLPLYTTINSRKTKELDLKLNRGNNGKYYGISV